MFCSKCGAGNQRADAYCTRCGEWLPDPKSPASRHGAAMGPVEKMQSILIFSGLNAVCALFAAIALYATYLGRDDARWSIYVAAGLCVMIAAHQTVSFIFGLQLRRRLARGRAVQVEAAAEGPAARSLGAADDRPFAGVRSVTESTTELLEKVPRAGGVRERT